MNKGQLIDAVASELGESKATVGRALEVIIDSIIDGIRKDSSVTISGFGTFVRKERRARIGRNPATGTPMEIKPSTTVNFKASPLLKDTFQG